MTPADPRDIKHAFWETQPVVQFTDEDEVRSLAARPFPCLLVLVQAVPSVLTGHA